MCGCQGSRPFGQQTVCGPNLQAAGDRPEAVAYPSEVTLSAATAVSGPVRPPTSSLLPEWLDPQVFLADPALGPWVVLMVCGIVFAETGLLIGFFLPGDSLLFTAGLLVATGTIDINVWLLAVLVFISAFVGDQTGYYIGRKAGPAVFNRPDSRLFKRENVKRAQVFFDRHGGKAVILARFVPVVRTFTPVVAGVAQMNYKAFVSFNAVGAAGSQGYARIATVTVGTSVTSAYAQQTIHFHGIRRTDDTPFDLYFSLYGAASDPPLHAFYANFPINNVSGIAPFEAVAYKTAPNTWDIYVRKCSGSDQITVFTFMSEYAQTHYTVTYSDALLTSIPSAATVAKSNGAGGYKRTIYDATGQTTTTLTNKTTFTLTEPALIKVSLLYNNSSPEEIVITDVPTSSSDNVHQVYAHMERKTYEIHRIQKDLILFKKFVKSVKKDGKVRFDKPFTDKKNIKKYLAKWDITLGPSNIPSASMTETG